MVLYDHYGAIQQGELAGRIVILVHGFVHEPSYGQMHIMAGLVSVY